MMLREHALFWKNHSYITDNLNIHSHRNNDEISKKLYEYANKDAHQISVYTITCKQGAPRPTIIWKISVTKHREETTMLLVSNGDWVTG